MQLALAGMSWDTARKTGGAVVHLGQFLNLSTDEIVARYSHILGACPVHHGMLSSILASTYGCNSTPLLLL